jgi:hypothetical protein
MILKIVLLAIVLSGCGIDSDIETLHRINDLHAQELIWRMKNGLPPTPTIRCTSEQIGYKVYTDCE